MTRSQQDLLTKAIAGFVILCLVGALLSTGYIVFHPELWDKLWKVATHNMGYWSSVVAVLGFAIWRKKRNPGEITYGEMVVQMFVTLFMTTSIFGVFLFATSGLYDTEVWNGQVRIAEYYEQWTEEVTYTEEECTGSGQNRSCRSVTKTREDHHPPKWIITTSNQEAVSISSGDYRNYVDKFGGHKKEHIYHINQVSIGDGNKYVATWPGTSETVVPTAVEHPYVNYMKASQSVQRRSGTIGPYASYIMPHPEVTEGKFGNIELNRVLVAGVAVSQTWKETVDKELDRALISLGSEKQVNLLVYVVKADRGFLHALEEAWIFGKKNEVVLIVGMNEFPRVAWAGVMVFQGNEELRVKLRDAIENTVDISDPKMFGRIFVQYIKSDFKRVPMAELEHLLYDVAMPWWSYLLVWFLSGMVAVVLVTVLENNQTRERV